MLQKRIDRKNHCKNICVRENLDRKKTQNHSANFHILTKLDTLGRNISFDADYFIFNSDRTIDFFTEDFDNMGVSQGVNSAAFNDANQQIENFSAKIDVEYPIKKVNLSYGVKASFLNTNSGVLFFDTFSGMPVLDPNRSNEFNYKEDILKKASLIFKKGTKLIFLIPDLEIHTVK